MVIGAAGVEKMTAWLLGDACARFFLLHFARVRLDEVQNQSGDYIKEKKGAASQTLALLLHLAAPLTAREHV